MKKVLTFCLIVTPLGACYENLDLILKYYNNTSDSFYSCDGKGDCKDAISIALEGIPNLQPPLKEYSKKDVYCLAKNIFEEASTETFDSKLYVAFGTINRVKSCKYPNNICNVVYEKNQFSWTKNKQKRNRKFPNEYLTFAKDVLSGRFQEPWCKITNWHNSRWDKKGSYNERMILKGKTDCTVTIGVHTYIKFKGA